MVRTRMLLLAALLLAVVALVMFTHQKVTRQNYSGRPTLVPSAAVTAPDFTLKQLNGTPLRLSDYEHKVILLDFFASWCAPCRDEIPQFVQWQAKYGNRGLQVIGVSMDDDVRPVQKFSRELRINYPVVVGTQEVASRYGGILGLPVNIVIGLDGKIVSKHVGMEDLSLLEQELTTQLELKKGTRPK